MRAARTCRGRVPGGGNREGGWAGFGLWLLGMMMLLLAGGARADERPNIVVMVADDMAWDDCGPFGHPAVRTPHLDRMAREGLVFDHACLTISSCSPSRCSILTGRYPHNTGAEELHWPLPAGQVTLAAVLRESGYWTGAAGKWHLGEAARAGFDAVREVDTSGFQLPTGSDGQAGRFVDTEAGAARSGCADWVPLLESRPRDRPFFAWLAALDPHRDYQEGAVDPPHEPGDVRLPPYHPDTPEVRADYALYYDEIARLDGYVGRVLAELDRQGVADNTLVVFFSDNGRPFPRDKTTAYDSGIKTPLVVRWPGRVAAGERTAGLVSLVDLAPTLLEAAGVAPGPTFQGRSFRRLLENPGEPGRRYLFAEKNWHDFEDHARAVRTTRWKYIRNGYPDLPLTPPADAVRSPTHAAMLRLHEAGELSAAGAVCFRAPRSAEELYDLQADPHEIVNLAGRAGHAGILNELRQALAVWEQETGDYLPDLRTADEFDRVTGKPTPARVRPRRSRAEMVAAGLVAP